MKSKPFLKPFGIVDFTDSRMGLFCLKVSLVRSVDLSTSAANSL